jgi:hypothetical protein
MSKVENAVTAAFEHFDFVVETFHKSAVLAFNKIIGDFFPSASQQFHKSIETLQATLLDLLHPPQDFGLRLFFG